MTATYPSRQKPNNRPVVRSKGKYLNLVIKCLQKFCLEADNTLALRQTTAVGRGG